MIGELLNHILRFVFLVLLQVVVLNNIQLMHGLMVPYVYPLIILLLPFQTKSWAVMLFALIVGLSVDTFTNTLGMHASASVLIGYLRGIYLKLISPRDGYEVGMKPNLQQMGFGWFFSYSAVLIFIHHLWLFNLEHFQFQFIFRTQLRVILSSIFSLSLIFLGQYLSFRVAKRR